MPSNARELPPMSPTVLIDWGLFSLSLSLLVLSIFNFVSLPMNRTAHTQVVGVGYLAGIMCLFWSVGRLACFRRGDGGIHPASLLIYAVVFLGLISTVGDP